MSKLEKYLYKLYKQFMKVNSDRDMSKVPSDRALSSIRNFIKAMERKHGLETLGDNFYHDYLLFQFSYWEWQYTERDTPFGQTFQIPWIFGPKAIGRWDGKKPFWKKMAYAKYKRIKKINLDDFVNLNKGRKKPDYISINNREELDKDRFYGTVIGFVHCQMTTTMHNPTSSLCQECKFTNDCRTKLAKTYPGIYLTRKRNERKQAIS